MSKGEKVIAILGLLVAQLNGYADFEDYLQNVVLRRKRSITEDFFTGNR